MDRITEKLRLTECKYFINQHYLRQNKKKMSGSMHIFRLITSNIISHEFQQL